MKRANTMIPVERRPSFSSHSYSSSYVSSLQLQVHSLAKERDDVIAVQNALAKLLTTAEARIENLTKTVGLQSNNNDNSNQLIEEVQLPRQMVSKKQTQQSERQPKSGRQQKRKQQQQQKNSDEQFIIQQEQLRREERDRRRGNKKQRKRNRKLSYGTCDNDFSSVTMSGIIDIKSELSDSSSSLPSAVIKHNDYKDQNGKNSHHGIRCYPYAFHKDNIYDNDASCEEFYTICDKPASFHSGSKFPLYDGKIKKKDTQTTKDVEHLWVHHHPKKGKKEIKKTICGNNIFIVSKSLLKIKDESKETMRNLCYKGKTEKVESLPSLKFPNHSPYYDAEEKMESFSVSSTTSEMTYNRLEYNEYDNSDSTKMHEKILFQNDNMVYEGKKTAGKVEDIVLDTKGYIRTAEIPTDLKYNSNSTPVKIDKKNKLVQAEHEEAVQSAWEKFYEEKGKYFGEKDTKDTKLNKTIQEVEETEKLAMGKILSQMEIPLIGKQLFLQTLTGEEYSMRKDEQKYTNAENPNIEKGNAKKQLSQKNYSLKDNMKNREETMKIEKKIEIIQDFEDKKDKEQERTGELSLEQQISNLEKEENMLQKFKTKFESEEEIRYLREVIRRIENMQSKNHNCQEFCLKHKNEVKLTSIDHYNCGEIVPYALPKNDAPGIKLSQYTLPQNDAPGIKLSQQWASASSQKDERKKRQHLPMMEVNTSNTSWKVYHDWYGNLFYYNKNTCEKQWIIPKEFHILNNLKENTKRAIVHKEGSIVKAPGREQEHLPAIYAKMKASTDRQFSIERSSSKGYRERVNSTPWILFKGKHEDFYFNTITGESQWENPADRTKASSKPDIVSEKRKGSEILNLWKIEDNLSLSHLLQETESKKPNNIGEHQLGNPTEKKKASPEPNGDFGRKERSEISNFWKLEDNLSLSHLLSEIGLKKTENERGKFDIAVHIHVNAKKIPETISLKRLATRKTESIEEGGNNDNKQISYQNKKEGTDFHFHNTEQIQQTSHRLSINTGVSAMTEATEFLLTDPLNESKLTRKSVETRSKVESDTSHNSMLNKDDVSVVDTIQRKSKVLATDELEEWKQKENQELDMQKILDTSHNSMPNKDDLSVVDTIQPKSEVRDTDELEKWEQKENQELNLQNFFDKNKQEPPSPEFELEEKSTIGIFSFWKTKTKRENTQKEVGTFLPVKLRPAKQTWRKEQTHDNFQSDTNKELTADAVEKGKQKKNRESDLQKILYESTQEPSLLELELEEENKEGMLRILKMETSSQREIIQKEVGTSLQVESRPAKQTWQNDQIQDGFEICSHNEDETLVSSRGKEKRISERNQKEEIVQTGNDENSLQDFSEREGNDFLSPYELENQLNVFAAAADRLSFKDQFPENDEDSLSSSEMDTVQQLYDKENGYLSDEQEDKCMGSFEKKMHTIESLLHRRKKNVVVERTSYKVLAEDMKEQRLTIVDYKLSQINNAALEAQKLKLKESGFIEELRKKMMAFGVMEIKEKNLFYLDFSLHQSEHLWSSRVCPNILL